MNVLTRLSLQNILKNKKRSLGTIVGIILSVALICAVAGMFMTFRQGLVDNTIENSGYYHVEISKIDEKLRDELSSRRDVERIMPIYEMGTSKFRNKNEKYPYIYVRSTEYFDEMAFRIKDGKKPENANEIVLNEKAMIDGELEIGDTIELELGIRMSTDGHEMRPSNPYVPEESEEYIKDPVHKTYKIVGVFERAGYSSYHYGITTKDTSNLLNAFVTLKNPKEYKKFTDYLNSTNKYRGPTSSSKSDDLIIYDTNRELLRWEIFAFSDSTITALYSIVTVVIGIIVITSVFCIRNSFAISTTEKSKMLGMLASVGATKKQIKRSVLLEGFLLGIVGIPLGVLSGIFADAMIVLVVNAILKGNDAFLFSHLTFIVSFESILVAILLGVITIYLSALTSAIKASRISPIENIHSSKDIKITGKKLKCPRIIEKLFKTGGVLAYKNLKRSKKKYRTTVVSLAVSVFIFISISSFLSSAFNLTRTLYEDYDYNVFIPWSSNLDEEAIERIRTAKNIENIFILYENNAKESSYIEIRDLTKLTDKERFTYETCDENGQNCLSYATLAIYALDSSSFQKYAEKMGLKYENIKEKGILVDEYKSYDEDRKESLLRTYNYKKGDTIVGKFQGKDSSFEIAEVASIHPYGLESSYYYGGYLIVDKAYYDYINFTPASLMIESSNSAMTTSDIDNMRLGLTVQDVDSIVNANKAINLIVQIFLYGFITVITLIGVTNIFNTITSNMELRQKEFAMLKSIGMTKREFNHMINLETLLYSTKALAYGIVLGIIGSIFVHKAFSLELETAYQIPWMPILLSIVFVFILVYIIMKFSISKIDKQNTIETIRKDNI